MGLANGSLGEKDSEGLRRLREDEKIRRKNLSIDECEGNQERKENESFSRMGRKAERDAEFHRKRRNLEGGGGGLMFARQRKLRRTSILRDVNASHHLLLILRAPPPEEGEEGFVVGRGGGSGRH
ncbi:hypothetical protein H6P81_017502 [Aristolochia fimbriata]|uniref:Uncharacterized protein n=1 Tax=Aristolochia fimbriata TaxID=158543 RepID=A0AAV7E2M7_ARIFI|nr:hypothetical protein H6P81_017502 [Aristolochia fimbriata]